MNGAEPHERTVAPGGKSLPAHRLKGTACAIPAVRAGLGNPAWDAATARVLIVRLSPFPDVQRSTPHLFLFAECRRALPGAFLDFAFLPERPDREALAAHGMPWFAGVASGRGPADFDLILVSNAYVLELVNLPWLLRAAGLPALASERSRLSGSRPLVVLGGSNALVTGAIVAEDGDAMPDGLFFGEGEEAVGELARILADRAIAPSDRLERAAAIPGFWPAGRIRPVVRRTHRPTGAPLPVPTPPVLNSSDAATARLQITRGCPAFCSFCLQGWERKPYREIPLADLLATARAIKRETGADTLELYSFNVNMHTDVFTLLLELNRVFRHVNFMSQRADFLARVPMLLATELAAGKRSFTIGVEGISSGMRAYYRKSVRDEDLRDIVPRILKARVRELKLFYILSGRETEEDVAEFAAFAATLQKDRAAHAAGLRVVFSFGLLVRLPFTPMQFEDLALDDALWRPLIAKIRGAVVGHGFEFRLAQSFDEYAAEQILALGGGTLLPWMTAAPDRGICFDGTLTPGAAGDLRAFAAQHRIPAPARNDAARAAYRPPLAFVGGGVAHERLHEEFLAARERRDAVLCLGGRCTACGACADGDERRFHTAHAVRVPDDTSFPDRIADLLRWKAALPEIFVAAELPADLAGAMPEYLSAWFLRRLFAARPAAAETVLAAREALFAGGPLADMLPVFTGHTRFAVQGSDAAALADALAAAGFTQIAEAGEPRCVRVKLDVPREVCDGAIRSFGRWLTAGHIGHSLVRADGGWRFDVAAKGLKRQVLLAGTARETAEGTRFDLALGRKAALAGWFAAMDVPWYRQSVSARVVGIED